MTTPPAPPEARFPLRPTRFGLAFLGLILLTLIGCVNYALSLGYGLTFLLGGVWIMTAAPLGRAARHLSLTLHAPPRAQAGGAAPYTVQAHTSGPPVTLRVQARTPQGERVHVTLRVPTGIPGTATLTVPAAQRGLLTLSGVRAAALDPLGLWQLPVSLSAPPAVPVQPAPERPAPPLPARFLPGGGEGQGRVRGHEDFAGLRPYVPGDSPRLISWRHAARSGQLLTRELDAPQGQVLHLDWADTRPAGGTEARLSRLSAWTEDARRAGLPFALTLPGTALPAGQGDAHAQSAQDALARTAPLPVATPAARQAAPTADPGALRATLLAVAVATLPLLLRAPLYGSALTFALLAYAAARTRRPWRALPTWLLGALAGLGGVALNAHYGTLLGASGGTAILALLIALKSNETRTPRDGHLLVLLGLFLTATHFFQDQGPLTALHVLISVAALLAAAARWVLPQEGGLRRAATLLALAAPVAVTLFVLFPRPDAPLWTLPVQGAAQTGLASQITAGEFSALAQDTRVALRADFQGALPPPDERYWRGPVYEAYDGRRWDQVRVPAGTPDVQVRADAPTWTYSITLEPQAVPWLLALDAPTQLPPGAVLTTAFQAAGRPSGARRRYALQSRPARLGAREVPERLEFNLRLPAQSPRARALGESWRGLTPAARVQAGLTYLQRGKFTYTLTPPTLPEQDRVDAFLFGTRAGFCEHYASAFAVLMRAAGLPTRIVGGYLGGQLNPDGGYLIVRQQDAHAWVEVWLPPTPDGRGGWTRVDPTAAIAPARVNANLGTALTQPQATAALPAGPGAQLQLRLDALQNRWNELIVAYDGAQQRDLLARAGLGGVGSAAYLLLLPLLVALALLPALLLVRSGRPRDPAAGALHDLESRLSLPRAPGETLTAYVERAVTLHPHLRDVLNDVLRTYHAARYAPGPPEGPLRALRGAVRRVRRSR